MSHKIFTPEQVKTLIEAIGSEKTASFINEIKAEVKENPEKFGTFKIVITTEDVDRVDEVVKMDGWLLQNYQKNPVVLIGHDYSELPTGITEKLYIEEGKMIAEGYFAPTEKAQELRMLYDLGFIKTASVGFIPKAFDAENPSIIVSAELLEWSFVPVPCNPNALSLMKSKNLDVEGLKEKGLIVEVEQKEVKEMKTIDHTEEKNDKDIKQDVKTVKEQVAKHLSTLSTDISNLITSAYSTISAALDTLSANAENAEPAKEFDLTAVKMGIDSIEALSVKCSDLKANLESLFDEKSKDAKAQSNFSDCVEKTDEKDLVKLLKTIDSVIGQALAKRK